MLLRKMFSNFDKVKIKTLFNSKADNNLFEINVGIC